MKPVFSYNSDIRKNAYLNWRMERGFLSEIQNMYEMANGYILGAERLLRSLLDDNVASDADAIIFPVLFSINHSIEVYLKSILMLDSYLRNEQVKPMGNHNIYQLYCELKSRNNASKEFNDLTTDLFGYIEEIRDKAEHKHQNKTIDGMDFSRYPIDKYSDPYFYVEINKPLEAGEIVKEGNVVVDLENLMIVLKKVGECLESIYYDYYCRAFPDAL